MLNDEILKKVAADTIENEWTTAEEDWKNQAKKNLKVKNKDCRVDEHYYLLTTHYVNHDPGYIDKRCDFEIRIIVELSEKEK